MIDLTKPLQTKSLRDQCVGRLEELILSGVLCAGERLPPERELARQLGVSRPVIHEALVDLSAKGLVSLTPRVGTEVNDFRTHGSLALLTSLVNFKDGILTPVLMDSLLSMRLVIEREIARLAATHCTKDNLNALKKVYLSELETDPADNQRMTEIDFEFHHRVAMASGNLVYPLFLNSFKPVYIHLSCLFFKDFKLVPDVIAFHGRLIDAISRKNQERAAEIMENLINHGENHLRASLAGKGGG